MKAFSYIRWSSEAQTQGDSLRRQTELAERYARDHGLDLDRELRFTDVGVSAFKGRNAKTGALRAFLRAVEDEIIPEGSYLLVESLDRLSRGEILDAQGLFLQIVNAGIVLVTLADGRLYSRETVNANPTDLIISLVVMMRARDESVTKSRRGLEAWQAKRRKVLAGETPKLANAPSWLRHTADGWELDDDRAAVVRRIFDLYLAGLGAHGIAYQLNEDQVPVFGWGKLWRRSTLLKILAQPAAMGTLVVDGEEIAGFYPAAVSEETFRSVQALVASKSPKRGSTTTVHNILGGLGRCPACGSTMQLSSKGSRGVVYRYLRCARAINHAGCSRSPVPYQPIEDAVLETIPRLVAEVPPSDPASDRRLGELDAEIAGLEDQSLELAHQVARGGPGVRALRSALRELEGQLEDHRQARSAVLARSSLSQLVDRRLGELMDVPQDDREGINRLLRQILDHVVVADYTVELVWRHRPDVVAMVVWRMVPEVEDGPFEPAPPSGLPRSRPQGLLERRKAHGKG